MDLISAQGLGKTTHAYLAQIKPVASNFFFLTKVHKTSCIIYRYRSILRVNEVNDQTTKRTKDISDDPSKIV